jgi:RNA polymerase sigma-70 factor, ECF subfamily
MPADPHSPALDLALVRLRTRPTDRPAAKDEPNMDEAAFRAFYEQTARPLFGNLLRVSGNRALSEDLLQEAYCRFLSRDLPAMNAAERKSYLFRTASNLLRDRWRQIQEEPMPEQVSERASSGHPERTVQVQQAFYRLKPRQRQLLWLAYVEGSSHQEIGRVHGIAGGQHTPVVVARPAKDGGVDWHRFAKR